MNSNRDQQPGLIPTAITHIPAASVCMQEMVPKYNNGSAQLLGQSLEKQDPNAHLQESWSPG